jgi:hypothetical protein
VKKRSRGSGLMPRDGDTIRLTFVIVAPGTSSPGCPGNLGKECTRLVLCFQRYTPLRSVMPGLVPGTHVFLATEQGVGGRDIPGTKCPGAAMTRGQFSRGSSE